MPEPVAAPADPVVSPADTIRSIIAYARFVAELDAGPPPTPDTVALADCDKADVALDALLAVGERDRQHIAQLTEALAERAAVADDIASECKSDTLAQFHSGRSSAFREAAAVLADKEDAE